MSFGGWGGRWGGPCSNPAAWCCSLQTCSDRLHMPGNLEFISPSFLIPAHVIQINSNEISRGKAPFGWGVCSSPVRSIGYSLCKGPKQPPTYSRYFNMWRNELKVLSLTDTWVSPPKKGPESSRGLRGFSLNA